MQSRSCGGLGYIAAPLSGAVMHKFIEVWFVMADCSGPAGLVPGPT